MENHQIVLRDENNNQYKVIRVKDTIFNAETLLETHQWLWVFAESYEFFPFELWEQLEHLKVNESLVYNNKKLHVIYIYKLKSLRFS